MANINVFLKDEDFERLKEAKGSVPWSEFLPSLLSPKLETNLERGENLDAEETKELTKLREDLEEVKDSITKLSESPSQPAGISIEPLLARISANESEIANIATLDAFKHKCRESSTFLEFTSNSSFKAAADSLGTVILKKLEKIGILKFDPGAEEKFIRNDSITTSPESPGALRQFTLRLGDLEDKIDMLEQSISKRNKEKNGIREAGTGPDQKPMEEVEEGKEGFKLASERQPEGV